MYIRYIYLFGNAVPLTIKAAIRKLVERRGQSLGAILTDKKELIRTFYNGIYKVLFESGNNSIDEQMESWDISTLCDVVFILNEQPNIDYVKCILDQRRNIEHDAKIASLDYKTFQMKYNALKESLLELFKDTNVALKCKRLIYSFDETKAKQLRNEVYESLKLTEDVEKHIEIVTRCASTSNSNAKNETEKDFPKANKIIDKEVKTVKFVKQLSNTIIRTGESICLMCELNKDDCHVVWSKNGEVLTNTKTVSILADKGRQYLFFQEAMLEDRGTYKCTYKDLFTSASLIISKQDVKMLIPLHNEYNGNINEYMKVELRCTINLPMKTPRWFHNDLEIERDNTKLTILSSDYEHRLIIHHAELDDNGEYIVGFDGITSKTSIKVKGHIDLTIKQQVKQKLYTNWIIALLGLKYLKVGLESPATKAVKTHHENILRDLPTALSNKLCSACNADNLLPLHDKKQCPRTKTKHKCLCSKSSHIRRYCPTNGLCGEIYGMIVRDHRYEDPAMRNTKVCEWKTDAWSVAVCYMSNTEFIQISEYRKKQSSKELDCTALLSLFINNKTYLPNTNLEVFEKARKHRNELLHSPNCEISDEKLYEYLKNFQDVLEVKDFSNDKVFGNYKDVKQSLIALDELRHTDIIIRTKEELEKIKKEVRDAAMKQAAEKFEASMKQVLKTQMRNYVLKEAVRHVKKDEEFKRIKKDLLTDHQNAKENMCEKHKDTESSWYCIEHGKLLCGSCMENEHRQCYGIMALANRYKENIQISLTHKESYLLGGSVIIMCTIPQGELLVLLGNEHKGRYTSKLCRLNKIYNIISSRAIVDSHFEMCYIGDNKVVSNNGHTFDFIDVTSLQVLRRIDKSVLLQCLLCNGNIIYACSFDNVFTFTTDGAPINTFCKLPDQRGDICGNPPCKLSYSNDGESLYCLRGRDLHKIDCSNGDIIFAHDLRRLNVSQDTAKGKGCRSPFLNAFEIGMPMCMSYIGNGQVIICDDRGQVLIVSDSGKYAVSNITRTKSAYFDTTSSRLFLGDESNLHILEVKKLCNFF